jgi:hypothetical protein
MTMRGLPSISLPITLPQLQNTAHDGMLLFIQYAFMPNRLDYCGTDDHGALYDYWAVQETDPGLTHLLQTFTGALPYLKLIAHSNNLADPFDRRVVEAYWVGNGLLDNVNMRQFFNSLVERFGKQLQGKARNYITQKIPLGARPHHSFHVFDVHSRVGQLTHSLEVMENCRISWGQITAVEPAHYVIEAQPLILQEGKLAGYYARSTIKALSVMLALGSGFPYIGIGLVTYCSQSKYGVLNTIPNSTCTWQI